MATVYLARDVRQGRPVAIKVIHPELAQAVGTERFLREIRIAASLNHPHILPLLDSGGEAVGGSPADGLLWYAMPYVEGESLRARLQREKQLPLADAIRVGRDVAAALAYAHSHGIIHRDIKPENILLAGNEALVADFGIARAIDAAGRDSLTPSGLTLGTPAYMSPEQAAGDSSLDGRSDVYSLGCVLYEMLAGEPPFTGPTAQAILAKRLSGPLPPLHLVRDAVAPEVEAAIERALARVAADRFATAGEFADALGAPPSPGSLPARQGSRRHLIILAAAVLLILIAAVLVRPQGGRAPPLDSNLLAVAPFDALAPSLQPWSEGIVDILSRSLDGAGAIRTVPPTVSLKGWAGRADRASAAALGRRTGAGLVLFGALERRGPDSLAIRAVLLDVAGRQSPSELEVAGDTLRLNEVVDSLAIAVLRELGRARPVGAVRRSPVGAKSLPALKAFLRGEQYYRRNLWDSALTQYSRALARDSTFALAYRKLGMVLTWYPKAAQLLGPLDQDALLRRASMFNHGLAPRDSLLVVADSLTAVVANTLLEASHPPPDHYALRRRLLDLLGEAERQYPQDPEIWYRIGEFRMHASDPSVATPAEVLSAFDHAIVLDSGFAPAYIHTPGLAIAADLGDPTRARRYVASYLRLNPTDERTVPLRLTAALLDPARARLPETGRLIDSADASVLWTLGTEYLSTWPDSAESAVAVLRALVVSGGLADFPNPDRRFQYRPLAFELTRRGHLKEAYGLYPVFGTTPLAQFLNPYDRLALFGAIPADTVAVTFRRALESDPAENATGLVPALAWWYAQGDTASLEHFALRVDSVIQRDTINPAVTVLRRYSAAAARAYLVLAQGDSAAALEAFAALPDSACGHGLVSCRPPKLTEARLLVAAGQDQKAAAVLDRWGELEPLALLERARIAERLGDRETALRCYRYVAAIWLHADPELQPYVREARTGLERLSAALAEGA